MIQAQQMQQCGQCGTIFDRSTFHHCSRIKPKCKWTFDIDSEYYDTECGEVHYFTADGIKENKFKFCPYCGRKIEEINK